MKPRPLLGAYISIHHHPAALMRLFSSNAPLLFARFLASAAARDQPLRRPVVKINSRTATDEKMRSAFISSIPNHITLALGRTVVSPFHRPGRKTDADF